MKKLVNFCCLFVALSFSTSCVENAVDNDGIIVISAEEMQTIIDMEDVQLVDVRTPAEYEELHITNAQNIDFTSPTFDDDVAKLDKDKPVILYCKAGGRSAKCSRKLKDAGFKKIYDLDGGLSRWQHSGKLSIERKS